MYYKAKYFGDEITAQKILIASNPKECNANSRISSVSSSREKASPFLSGTRKVTPFNDQQWSQVRVWFMYVSCKEKFSSPVLKSYLLDQHYAHYPLAEMSPRDRTWGTGLGAGTPLPASH
jgi:predicted NAD-dependent protein-ADP-ribosyltransferase YbiA (DUF1768 family)